MSAAAGKKGSPQVGQPGSRTSSPLDPSNNNASSNDTEVVKNEGVCSCLLIPIHSPIATTLSCRLSRRIAMSDNAYSAATMAVGNTLILPTVMGRIVVSMFLGMSIGERALWFCVDPTLPFPR